MLSRRSSFVVALAVTFLTSSSSFGDAKADARKAADLFKHSKVLYQSGDFDGAAKLLRDAYAIKPEPVLLYNLARACEGSGDKACAVDAYGRYLEGEKNPPDRGAIEKRVETLKQEIQEKKKRDQPPPPPPPSATPTVTAPPPPPPPAPRRASAVPWVVAGVGVVGLGAGFVIGGLAKSGYSNAKDDPTVSGDQLAQKRSSSASLATAANVAIIAGGAVAGVGLVWGIVDVASSGKRSSTGFLSPSLSIAFGPSSIVARGAF